jgi:hypothetical protein
VELAPTVQQRRHVITPATAYLVKSVSRQSTDWWRHRAGYEKYKAGAFDGKRRGAAVLLRAR